MGFTPEVIDHFEHPRCAGELPEANLRARMENPVCGDVLELSAIYRDGVFAAVRFQAKGCVASMAAASALAELLQGKRTEEAAQIQRADLVSVLGGLSTESMHVSHLALDALHALLAQAKALRN